MAASSCRPTRLLQLARRIVGPHLVRGDLNESLRDLAVQAPSQATLVVFHSAVIAYLDQLDRQAFVDTVRDLPGDWIANEGPGVRIPVPIRTALARSDQGTFLLEHNAAPVAWSDAHGQTLDWLS